MKINRLENKTIVRFGVIPLVNLVIIADSAIEFMIIANIAKANKIRTLKSFVLVLSSSEMENTIIAITAKSTTLKRINNSLSSKILLSEKIRDIK